MTNVIDFNYRKTEKENMEIQEKEDIFNEFDEEMDEFNAVLNRLNLKASNGKELSDNDIFKMLTAMDDLGQARRKRKEKLNNLNKK